MTYPAIIITVPDLGAPFAWICHSEHDLLTEAGVDGDAEAALVALGEGVGRCFAVDREGVAVTLEWLQDVAGPRSRLRGLGGAAAVLRREAEALGWV